MPKRTQIGSGTTHQKDDSVVVREDSPSYCVNGTPSEHKLRFIDLFCGIGGFRIAFEKAGGACVFSSDWDNYSRQTYKANFGEEPRGDIHSVAVADIPKFDILCGGFPCQPFSLAGVSKKNSLGRKHGFEVSSGKLPCGDSRENPAKARPTSWANESVVPRTERSSAPVPVAGRTSSIVCSTRLSAFHQV